MKAHEELGIDYDSDDSYSGPENEDDEEFGTEKKKGRETLPEHLNPHGYAWSILRLALVSQIVHRIQQFLTISGFETSGMLVISTFDLVFD